MSNLTDASNKDEYLAIETRTRDMIEIAVSLGCTDSLAIERVLRSHGIAIDDTTSAMIETRLD